MSSCSRASQQGISRRLHQLRQLVCVQCRVEHDDKTYCQPCAEKLFVVKETPPEAKPVLTPTGAKPVLTPSEPKPVLTCSRLLPPPVPGKKELPQTALEKKQIATPEVKASPQPGLPTILGVNILWYVAVLFLGWIGGLIAWWKNKKQAPQASRYLLFGGIGWSAVQGVLAVILVAVLIITPALKAGFKWPFTAVKPASVTQESQWMRVTLQARPVHNGTMSLPR